MRSQIARETLVFRHLIVKLIAPQIYDKVRNPLPRGMIKAIKRKFSDKRLMGVEIGVWKGIHAESILQTLNIERLFLVDPYKSYSEVKGDMNQAFFEAQDRLKIYENKVFWVRKRSEDAVINVPNELDFVYVDGNHDYEFVKKDIELYYPKVKEGGILGGHDFHANWKGIIKAVIEFITKEGLEIYVEAPADWWVIKKC